MDRPLSSDEAVLWARVLETVRPLRVAPKPVAKIAPTKTTPAKAAVVGKAPPRTPPATAKGGPVGTSAENLFRKLLELGVGGIDSPKGSTKRAQPAPPKAEALRTQNTLDGSWDRKLTRGLVSPDCSIDLHGHNLSTAYATLDNALEQAIRMGDRVVLLVTGKPPRAESERPHARGAIRAAVGDWLAGSRHSAAITAVRAAHPRHGGAGALYIILRRTDPNRIY